MIIAVFETDEELNVLRGFALSDPIGDIIAAK